MSERKLLFSITRKDFRVDYYKGSGKGGQKRNKTENCCRITHIESGSVGKSEESRSKDHNKKTAFERCINSETFQKWHKIKVAEVTGQLVNAEEWADNQMRSENLRIEFLGGKEELE